uniref:Transmembrane 9 superfamily member n=1 Tax=Lactuca sativa TaxID=4236 RepID=A0A9R1VR57_LACSA|nr:hypothetical protein LSAT_V11C400209250 [Lactuca sativa]
MVPQDCLLQQNSVVQIRCIITVGEVFLMTTNLKSSSKRMWRRLQFVSLNSMKQMLSTLRKLLTITIGLSFSWIIHVNLTQENPKPLEVGKTLDMTYSVKWTETNITFACRFDVYLDYHFFEHQIHWFSIFNLFMMVIFLIGLVSMILMRTLRNDYAKYAREDDDLESLERGVSEESSWKLVHGDVFRTPRNLVLLSAVVGTENKDLLALILIKCGDNDENCHVVSKGGGGSMVELKIVEQVIYMFYCILLIHKLFQKYMSKLSNDFCYETERREDLESKINMIDYLMTSVMKQKEMMVDNFNRDVKMVQEKENVQLKRINTKYEKTKLQLEDHEKKLSAREVINERENKKLDTEKKMVLIYSVGNFGAEEVLVQKEKEKPHQKIIELQKKLDDKQRLELEIK